MERLRVNCWSTQGGEIMVFEDIKVWSVCGGGGTLTLGRGRQAGCDAARSCHWRTG